MSAEALFILFTIRVSFIDIKNHRIPNEYLIIPAIGSLVLNIGYGWRVFSIRCIQAIVILTLLLIFRWFVHGKFGLGDVKLLATSTLAFGFVGVIIQLFFASLCGIIWGPHLRGRISRIPFAPFLAFGMVVAFILQNWIRIH